jgi:hypothetical protein
MSPVQIAHGYGYSEVPLGGDRYDVTYLTPSQRSLRSPSAQQATGAEERTQGNDFALWRAAQLALANGFQGFRTSNVRVNLDTYVDDSYNSWYGPPYAPGYYPYRWAYPYGPPGPYWGPSPYAFLQTQVTIEAQLLHAPETGDYEAAGTIEQLRRTYPDAEGMTAPAPSTN